MKKSRNLLQMVRLYLAYHLNKTALIVLGLVFFLWAIVLLINTGYPLDMENYILVPKIYHTTYLEQSIFFLEIIDGVVVAFLVGAELSSLSLFDPMLVPNVSRIKIILAKLLANLGITLGIVTFQILLLELIGLLIFPKYVIHLSDFFLIIYTLLPMLELLLLGECISIVLSTYFIPILIFIVHILCTSLKKVENISEILNLFLPKIEITATHIALIGNMSIYFSVCIGLILGIALLFQKKDISNG
ncbi:MAG: hypothetical protein K2N65_05750 [Anaeroplasmataceae bacterium]|nr:hypothetical protein [Anaeroplasmataceae bacterium]